MKKIDSAKQKPRSIRKPDEDLALEVKMGRKQVRSMRSIALGLAFFLLSLYLQPPVNAWAPRRKKTIAHPIIVGGGRGGDLNDSLLPEGLIVQHNAVSENTWEVLEHWLKKDAFPEETTPSSIPWEIGAQNRRVAQFGFRYNYDTSVVEFDDSVPGIPQPLRTLLLESCHELLANLQDPAEFTQCIINVYENDIQRMTLSGQNVSPLSVLCKRQLPHQPWTTIGKF